MKKLGVVMALVLLCVAPVSAADLTVGKIVAFGDSDSWASGWYTGYVAGFMAVYGESPCNFSGSLLKTYMRGALANNQVQPTASAEATAYMLIVRHGCSTKDK